MKQFLFSLLILSCFSCKKESAVCTDLVFGQSLTLAHEDLVCIENVEYTFIAKDERCPCGMFCVWEGEFVFSFEDSDGTSVYTFRESQPEINADIPFGESMEILSITNEVPDCGDDSRIDEARFTIVIN